MKNERLMKKRKTLHACKSDAWLSEWGTKKQEWRVSKKTGFGVPFKWYATFQLFGTVTYCGLRVKTFSKLAETTETVTCSSCRSGYALDLLANAGM